MFRKPLQLVAAMATLAAPTLFAQTALSTHWEDLTSPDFVQALQRSSQTCLLPFGIVEKHGPSGPLGTDLMNGRYVADLAARQEYTIIFPPYYFGQIAEARSQPGTLAYPTRIQMDLLQVTVEEMARNGCRKIIIQSAHGGNTNLIHYFAQTQMDTRHEYVVYGYFGNQAGADVPAAAKASKPGVDGHAGEGEISNVMAHTPQDAHPERAGTQSGVDQKRLNLPASVYTGIWWYASYPNHYQGDASGATAARGKAATDYAARQLAEALKAIKADTSAAALQKEFFDKTDNPVTTRQ
jgi:creatinine amidohydrolase